MAKMEMQDRLVVFTLGEQRYRLPLSSVKRVARIVEITPLPSAPEVVHGVINVQGRLIRVVNLRRRFCLPERDLAPIDQILVAHPKRRTVAVAADALLGTLSQRGYLLSANSAYSYRVLREVQRTAPERRATT